MTQEGTPNDILLDLSKGSHLSPTEEARQIIPAETRQTELGRIGHATDHTLELAPHLPLPGENAILQYPNGSSETLRVTGYDPDHAHVAIPAADGHRDSTIHLGAFEQLTDPKRQTTDTK